MPDAESSHNDDVPIAARSPGAAARRPSAGRRASPARPLWANTIELGEMIAIELVITGTHTQPLAGPGGELPPPGGRSA